MKGPPQNPTSALSERQLGADEAHGLEHGAESLIGIRHPQPLDVGERPDRALHHRAHALDQLDVDAHAQHRSHDVREQHGSVDVVAPDRLQRHLGAELRSPRELEERVTLSQRAILGKRASGLTHEPNGRALHVLAPESAHQKRLGHGKA